MVGSQTILIPVKYESPGGVSTSLARTFGKRIGLHRGSCTAMVPGFLNGYMVNAIGNNRAIRGATNTVPIPRKCFGRETGRVAPW